MEIRPTEQAVVLGPFERGVAHFDESDLFFRYLNEVHPTGGLLVDVGAHHGGSIRQFCESGWTVHAFEPDPNNRRILRQNVDSAWSLHVNKEAVAEVDGQTVDFFASSESSGVSGLSPFLDSHERVAQVKTVRLSTYIADHSLGHVDYLKIDTEGHDLFVLKSFPWDSDAPDAIECEFEDNKTVDLGYTSDELADFLIDHGYQVLVSEWHPIIRYGISHDFSALRRYEPGTISGQAWGNFLAVRSPEAADALVHHAKARGADIRERIDNPAAERGVAIFPEEFPDSPSAIPSMAGAAERSGVGVPTTNADRSAIASAPNKPLALAKRLVKFYLAPTGLVLAAALALVAVALIGFDFSWLFGIAGIGLLGLYLPYKFAKVDERQFAQSNALHERARAARVAADGARSEVGDLHQELRRSIERLDERIDRLGDSSLR